MGALDLSSLLWPDADVRRQPRHPVKLQDAYAGGVAFIGPMSISAPVTLPETSPANPAISVGESIINARPPNTNGVKLGASDGSHLLVARLQVTNRTGYFYPYTSNGIALAFAPFHSGYGGRAIVYDGTVLDSGVVLPAERFATVVLQFLPGQTAIFIDGSKAAVGGRTVSNDTWKYQLGPDAGGAVNQSLLAWIPGVFSDAECIRISDEPYSALFEPIAQVGFDFPAASGGTSQDLAGSGAATASGTASLAAQIALAGVGVSLASGTATPKIDIALSALGLAVSSGSATLSGAAAGSLAASGAATASGSAALAANVTISATGLAQAAAAAGLSAAVLLAGAGAAAAAGNAALAVQLQALAQGAAQAGGSATVSGSAAGELSGYGQASASGAALLTLDVRLAAAGSAGASGSGTLQEYGTAVNLTAAGFVQAMGAGVLKIDIALAAIGAGRASGAALLVPAGLAYSSARRLAVAAENRRLAVAAENRKLVIA